MTGRAIEGAPPIGGFFDRGLCDRRCWNGRPSGGCRPGGQRSQCMLGCSHSHHHLGPGGDHALAKLHAVAPHPAKALAHPSFRGSRRRQADRRLVHPLKGNQPVLTAEATVSVNLSTIDLCIDLEISIPQNSVIKRNVEVEHAALFRAVERTL